MNRPYAAFVCVWLAVVGLTVYFSFWAYTKVDVRHRCGSNTTRDCLARSAAVVRSSTETRSHVREEGGETSVSVGLPIGAQVYVERWNGRIVSVVDRATRRRYTTPDWPGRENDRAFAPAMGWAILLGLCWLVWSLVLAVRRWRRSAVT